MVESISKKATGRLKPGCANAAVVLFLSLFCIFGIAVATFMSFLPIYRAIQSRSWRAATCEVLSSRVVRSGDTFRPDIQYRYHVDDRPYTGTRYDFVPGSNNISDYQSVVDRYPPGHQFECYVDPADPTQAVISRELTFGYFFGLIFVVFFTVIPGGFIVIWFRVAEHLREKQALSGVPAAGRTAAAASGSRGRAAEASGSGSIELKPKTSPLGKLVAAVVVCLFWNGIVGLFTYFEVTGIMSGQGWSWFLAVFLLIFQFVGLAMIVYVPYLMLALANPRPTITLSRESVPVGGSLTIEWHLSGAAHRVRSLSLTLEGREEARYRRGTDTHTDTNVFHRATLTEVGDSLGVARGTTSIRIPDDAMHTFTTANNKIIWAIRMKGHINRWPDIDETFDITVTPR
jgi:Protein of unknown function (DUF3592)